MDQQDQAGQDPTSATAEAGGEAAAPEGAASGAPTDGAADPRAEAEEWKKRYLYAAADMDNIRRRARQEADDARRYANEKLVGDLLPVLDNFSRALGAAEQGGSVEALRAGVEMIQRQLQDALARAGLQKIDAVGQPFDPNLHEAIMQVEPEGDQAPHTVVEELQAGYRLNDRVVRPTLVKVTSA